MKLGGQWLKVRITLVFLGFIFLFAVVFFRAFQVQVVDGSELKTRADNQHIRNVKIPSKRGGIYDRNLEELAVSMEVDSVYAQPASVRDVATTARTLAPMLSVKSATLKRSLGQKKNFVWLKRQLELRANEREKIGALKGVGFLKEKRRFYPGKNLASNLVGFVGIDSSGLEGVELEFDKYLKGSDKSVKAGRDATGRLLYFEDIAGEAKGLDVILTIDKTIQYITEKALKKALISSGAAAATAIVMDPYTGEILAIANYPTFDPNSFSKYRPNQWRNRAVTDSFEPGSTIKAFLLAAVLDEGVVDTDDIFYCENGTYDVGSTVFHDHDKYGWLTLKDIIKKSSNIGALKVGERLGEKKYYQYLTDFGFGERTGIDLPGEARGTLAHYSKWSGISLDTISFGQGLSATALQLTTAMSAIANGGLMMEPRILKSLRSSGGEVVKENEPVVTRRVISKESATKATKVLTSVTEPGGTGELASLGRGFKVAGKTGTAQKADLVKGGYKDGFYIASFLGFVPAKNPVLTIFVAVDEPGTKSKEEGPTSGGVIAGPAFKEIAKESLSYLGIFHEEGSGSEKRWFDKDFKSEEDLFGSDFYDAEEEESKELPVTLKTAKLTADSEETSSSVSGGVTPNFKGLTMRMALRQAAVSATNINVKGDGGVAVSQRPKAGTPLGGKGVVEVVFRGSL